MEAKNVSKQLSKEISLTPVTKNVITVKEKDKIIVVEHNGKEDEEQKEFNNDNQGQNKATYWNVIHIFSIVGSCILFSSPVLLIPQHDTVQFPEYWYELLMTFSLTYPIHWTLLSILGIHFILKIKSLESAKTCLVIALSSILGFTLFYCSLYLFWTYHLGYNFPMPLGNLLFQITAFFLVITQWCLFPKELKMQKQSRSRLTSFSGFNLWVYLFLGGMIYNSLNIPLKKMPTNFQPIMAIVLPLFRSFEAKVLSKILRKCCPKDDQTVESYSNIISNVNFLLFVTVSLSSNTTNITTSCILFC